MRRTPGYLKFMSQNLFCLLISVTITWCGLNVFCQSHSHSFHNHTPQTQKTQQSNHPFCCRNIFVPTYKASSFISPFHLYFLRKTETSLITASLTWIMWYLRVFTPPSVTTVAGKRCGFAFFQSRERELECEVLLKCSNLHEFSVLVQLWSRCLFNYVCYRSVRFQMFPLFNIIWIHTIPYATSFSFLGPSSALYSCVMYTSLKEIMRLSM